ncbi:helix-turn-helix domain-containing protein [Bacillus thuringiensis]|uniref:Transcriptional regulator n=1 Tax=Bacillus thuringiensis TaxID=1428 RepID=A0A9X6TQI9_BACTU|nr:helix-turn-helix transcriptional regulator [Bacillus thuringiensis]PEA90745.1 transcriptional regulator [Bacillus thuringiensis]
MELNERLKLIRDYYKMSMSDFGEKIGMTSSNVSRMEKGQRVITDRTIKLVCSELGIDENWLRTGEGEMFAQLDEDEKLMKFVANLVKSEDKNTQELFMTLYSLKDEYFEIARDLIMSLEKRSSQK